MFADGSMLRWSNQLLLSAEIHHFQFFPTNLKWIHVGVTLVQSLDLSPNIAKITKNQHFFSISPFWLHLNRSRSSGRVRSSPLDMFYFKVYIFDFFRDFFLFFFIDFFCSKTYRLSTFFFQTLDFCWMSASHVIMNYFSSIFRVLYI